MSNTDENFKTRRTPVWLIVSLGVAFSLLLVLGPDRVYRSVSIGIFVSIIVFLCCLSIVVVSRVALRKTSLLSGLVLFFGTAIGFWLSGVCSRQFAIHFRDHFERLGMLTAHTFLWGLVSPFVFWLTVATTLVIIYRPRIPVILVPTLCGVAILMGAVKFFTNELSRAYPLSSVGHLILIRNVITTAVPLVTLGLLLRQYSPMILNLKNPEELHRE